MSEKTRSFLAVEITEPVRRSLEELVDRLDLPQFHVRWVQPKNMHLTLRFLGEIPGEDLTRVSDAARRAAAGTPTFPICLKGLGTFPLSGLPRIVWAGMEDDRDLLRLEKHLSRELTGIGWPPPDKPFRAHLTLGRVKSGPGIEELKKQVQRNRTAIVGAMTVEALSLVKSELRPSGPLYTVLERFSLLKVPQGGEGS